MKKLINAEAKELCKKFNFLTKEQAVEIVRFTMNRYTGRAKLNDPIDPPEQS